MDFDIWDNLKKNRSLHEKNSDLIRIGYTGCGNHSGDLQVIKKPILALLDEFPNLEFISLPFSNEGEIFQDINHPRFIKWNYWVGLSQFPQLVSDWELDMGIAPLKDNEFNRSKSNLRWLEYSALHIPTIASFVYPFQNSINNKKDGILVGNSEKEWYDALKDLIQDKEKRNKIGEEAYLEVRKNYDMEEVAKGYMSVLKEIKREFITTSGRMQ